MQTAAWPTRIRDVRAATAARKISGGRREEDLRRAHVRVLDERVVLDGPDRVEPDLLGVDRLLEAVADRLAFDVRRPVLDLGLEDHRELHARSFSRCRRSPGHPRREQGYPHGMIVNVEQSDAWNGNEGLAWAAHQDRHDVALTRFNAALADAAAIATTERVLDVGCGCGQSTREAARAASQGRALGIDLSMPMLERARERAAEEGLTNVSFVQGDAQVHEFDRGAFDVVISRFGAMFFADPVAAFTNIGAALHPDARLALVVWMPLDQNEWLSVIREALAMGRTLPAPQVGSPGPFGLAEPGYAQTMLEAAGYTGVAFDEFRERDRSRIGSRRRVRVRQRTPTGAGHGRGARRHRHSARARSSPRDAHRARDARGRAARRGRMGGDRAPGVTSPIWPGSHRSR